MTVWSLYGDFLRLEDGSLIVLKPENQTKEEHVLKRC
jgi:hypothetical protein